MTQPPSRLTPVSLLLAAVRYLPLPVLGRAARGLAGLVRVLAPLLLRRELRQLRTNVHRILGLPPGTHFAAAFERQVVRHQVVCTLETLRLAQTPAAATVAGASELAARLAAAEAAGLGHVMITAHLGSWELCAYFVQALATRPFHVLAKPSRSRAVTRALGTLRAAMGVRVLWTDRKTLLREMLAALRAGDQLGFVMDQKPEGRIGPVVPFLGMPTAFVSGPARMAIRMDCPVTAIFCLREGPLRYRLVTAAVAEAHHGLTDEVALTALCAAAIEAQIRAYPEQWTWNYRRWRFAAV